MRGSFFLKAVAALAVSSSASACAMMPSERDEGRCRVVGEEKLAADSGGSGALCAAIRRAMAARAPGVAYSVEVRVLSASRLAATLTTSDGRTLPEFNQASMDRKLGRSSFERFADVLAGELARTASR